MLSDYVEKFVGILIRLGCAKEADEAILCYGILAGLDTVIIVMTSLGMGLVLNLFWETCIFLLAFSLLRSYAGGFHCKKASTCFVASNGVVFCAILVTRLSKHPMFLIATCFIALLSMIALYGFMPVETPAKPLDELEKNHYRRKSRMILGIEASLVLILVGLEAKTYATVMAMSIIVTAILAVLGMVTKDRVSKEKGCRTSQEMEQA